MKFLNILIVEDEILIAETIKLYLVERGHQVLNIAVSYEEAQEAFYLRTPDLVLLDIRLYGQKSGIDFAGFLLEQKENVPFIYLTSQYDQRILDNALKTNPYGYLTKPIIKESLWTSIESAYNLFSSIKNESNLIFIADGKNNYSVKPEEIIYIEADHVYTKIYKTNNQNITTRKSLQQLFQMMEFDFLIYCHRSFIINTKFITGWNHEVIFLNKSITIPISRSRKNEVLEKIKEF